MRLWIKYDSVFFRAAETCQDCHLFSDSIAVKWQFKSGGLSLSWQVFNLCSISAHCGALFCIHCFFFFCLRTSFISRGFVVFSLPISPSYVVTFAFFPHSHLLFGSFILCCTVIVWVRLKERHQLPVPALTPPPGTSDHPAGNSPTPSWVLPHGAAARSFCSRHLFCWVINWDEHVGWRPCRERGGAQTPQVMTSVCLWTSNLLGAGRQDFPLEPWKHLNFCDLDEINVERDALPPPPPHQQNISSVFPRWIQQHKMLSDSWVTSDNTHRAQQYPRRQCCDLQKMIAQ